MGDIARIVRNTVVVVVTLAVLAAAGYWIAREIVLARLSSAEPAPFLPIDGPAVPDKR